MILELATAILSKYNADAVSGGVKASTNGMFSDEAPQSTKAPFITYSFITTGSEWSFGSNYDSPLVQFSIWSDDASALEAETIGGKLVTLYADQLLTVSGFTTVRADKVGEHVMRDPDKGWQYIVEIRYIEQNTG